MNISNLAFAEYVWNPIVGCTKISEGCTNCYAEIVLKKLKSRRMEDYAGGFEKVTVLENRMAEPLKLRKPATIIVNDLSDTFHEDIQTEALKRLFWTMNTLPQHRFLVATKRIERAVEIHQELNISQNIWLGVSVEMQKYMYRLDSLKLINAPNKFLMLSPLIGEITELDLTGIQWLIIRGEHCGATYRRAMYKSWLRFILKEADRQKVPVWFEGWGPKRLGSDLDGKLWREKP